MKASPLVSRLRRFIRAGDAVSTLEYALLVGLMAMAAGAAAVAFSDDLQTAIGANIGGDVGALGVDNVGPVQADTDAN